MKMSATLMSTARYWLKLQQIFISLMSLLPFPFFITQVHAHDTGATHTEVQPEISYINLNETWQWVAVGVMVLIVIVGSFILLYVHRKK